MKIPTFGEVQKALPTIAKLSGFLATAGIFATMGSSGLDAQLAQALGFQGDEAKSTAFKRAPLCVVFRRMTSQ